MPSKNLQFGVFILLHNSISCEKTKQKKQWYIQIIEKHAVIRSSKSSSQQVTPGVMVIVVANGHGNPCSNSVQGCLHFT